MTADPKLGAPAAPVPDPPELEEREIPSVSTVSNAGQKRLIPFFILGAIVLFAAYVMVGGLRKPAPKSLIPAATEEFGLPTPRGNEVPAYGGAPAPPPAPEIIQAPAAQGEDKALARLREQEARQKMQLEKQAAEMEMKLNAAKKALELRAQEQDMKDKAERARQEKERMQAPSLIFDKSKAEKAEKKGETSRENPLPVAPKAPEGEKP